MAQGFAKSAQAILAELNDLTDVTLTSPASGQIMVFDSIWKNLTAYKFPLSDGSVNQVLQTDGSGALTFQDSAGGGIVVQVVNVQDGDLLVSSSVIIPDDDTIPQSSEGVELMTLIITPTSATNVLKIEVVCAAQENTNFSNTRTCALFQDATANALAGIQSGLEHTGSQAYGAMVFTHFMVAGTTSATTFKVRVGADVSGAIVFNGINGVRRLGGVMASSITITEITV